MVVCLPKSRWGINMKSQRKYLLLGNKNPPIRPSLILIGVYFVGIRCMSEHSGQSINKMEDTLVALLIMTLLNLILEK